MRCRTTYDTEPTTKTLSRFRTVLSKLGRKYKGYFVADLTADVRVYRDTASTQDASVILPLKASGAATAKVWVF